MSSSLLCISLQHTCKNLVSSEGVSSSVKRSLLVDIEKKNLFLVWRLLGGTSQVGVFLHFFVHLYLAHNQLTHSFGSILFRKLGQNPRL